MIISQLAQTRAIIAVNFWNGRKVYGHYREALSDAENLLKQSAEFKSDPEEVGGAILAKPHDYDLTTPPSLVAQAVDYTLPKHLGPPKPDPTDAELVGKLCMVWDIDEDVAWPRVVDEYHPTTTYAYEIISGDPKTHARPLNREEQIRFLGGVVVPVESPK